MEYKIGPLTSEISDNRRPMASLWKLSFAQSKKLAQLAPIVLGSVLVLAGLLKCLAFASSSTEHNLSVPQDALLVVSAVELILGICLMWGDRSRLVYGGVGGLLVGFWIYHGMNIHSAHGCGCFGALQLSRPLELLVLVGISLAYWGSIFLPSSVVSQAVSQFQGRANLVSAATITGILFLGIIGMGYFTSPRDLHPRSRLSLELIAPTRSNPLVIEKCTLNDPKAFSLTMENVTSRPISLVGAKVSCTCLKVSDLPRKIGAGDKANIACELIPHVLGDQTQFVRVYTDRPGEYVEFLIEYSPESFMEGNTLSGL